MGRYTAQKMWGLGRSGFRWAIVDGETGEIVDDAQGYGYKTPQKAHAAWNYKQMPQEKKDAWEAKKQAIRTWQKEHKSICNYIDGVWFSFNKERLPFGFAEFKRFLELKLGKNFELPFTEEELWRGW